ncbi:hypothetical protein [Corallococcus macrosporus]|uniref:Uncharacterized protein n=1 Tax=Corallococcus macrosporus DSM 14697 TaxID=1189310 RepID=A0A250JZ98_9BACT|nr:hypothetical protein [Corallococcus macrosporus]ATB49179.1 hypothetical protein MYMAC_004820 [Corallococcus macrosporus DSM 14697]
MGNITKVTTTLLKQGARGASRAGTHGPTARVPRQPVAHHSTTAKTPSQLASEVRARNNSLDLMSDIMEAMDRRDGGNNASMPRLKPDVPLSRRENFAFDAVQPGYGTPKSAIDTSGKLQPAGDSPTITAADHVDGEKSVKAKTPYTSFSGPPVGVDGKATGPLVDNPLYGKDRIVTNPAKDLLGGAVLDQFDIQRDLRTSTRPGFDETAVLRSEPRPQPLWRPTEEERAIMPQVGVDPEKPTFTFRERAMVNSARDNEYLLKGTIHEFDFFKGLPDGSLKPLSKQEVIDEALKKL